MAWLPAAAWRVPRACKRGRFGSVLAGLPEHILEREYGKRGAAIVDGQDRQARWTLGGRPGSLFDRQVLACLAEPSLRDGGGLYADDVIARSSRYLDASAGAADGGQHFFEAEAAAFLAARDGGQAPPAGAGEVRIFDCGASAAAAVCQLVLGDAEDSALLPAPQPPIFGETVAALGRRSIPYFLDEKDDGWDLELGALEEALQESVAEGARAKLLVVSNPGQPTGRVLPRSAMEHVLSFAARERLALLVDETLQDSLFEDAPSWISFCQVAQELESPVEVFSIHAVSQGMAASSGAGLEAAVLHSYGVSSDVQRRLSELALLRPRPSFLAQAFLCSALTAPPADGPSSAAYDEERAAMRADLSGKARLVAEQLGALEGVTCPRADGGAFAYPRIIIKGYVIKKAISFATPADRIYCLELAERSGVGLVPGSSFGQRPGHFHFRLGLAQDVAALEEDLSKIATFHAEHPGGWFL